MHLASTVDYEHVEATEDIQHACTRRESYLQKGC